MLPQLSNRLHPDRKFYPERIVQFGGGNFLRGFVDWVVDVLNAETDFASSIVIVKATPGTYDELDEQDCLFTTYLHGIQEGELVEETRLISAVQSRGVSLSRLRRLSGAGASAGSPLHLLQHNRVRHRVFRR